jgi:hypothetical protein
LAEVVDYFVKDKLKRGFCEEFGVKYPSATYIFGLGHFWLLESSQFGPVAARFLKIM